MESEAIRWAAADEPDWVFELVIKQRMNSPQQTVKLGLGLLSAVMPAILFAALALLSGFAITEAFVDSLGELFFLIFPAALGVSTWLIFNAPVSVRRRIGLLLFTWVAIGAQLLLYWLLKTAAPPLMMIDTL